MDLYDIYEELFPDISEEELYNLPSPTSILRGEWCPFPIIYLDKGGPIHTVVICIATRVIEDPPPARHVPWQASYEVTGVQDTLIRISDPPARHAQQG